MKNLFTCLSKKSLSLENGSGMHRDCIGDGPAVLRKLFASIIFLLSLGVGQMWGVEIYSNAGATGTSGGVTASGNVNTNSANGNPGNSFANTTSDNATFTFTGFSVSGYGALKLSIDAAFKSFPNTTNTWPYATVTFKKNNVAVKTDNTTIKWSSKDNSYSTYTIDNIPDFDKIEIVGSPAFGKTKKGDDATNYAIYMDNITLTGCPNPTSLTNGTITSSTAQLSWSDASDVGSYEVFRSTSSSTPAANETPTATVTSKSVTFESLTASTTYYWWVRTKCSNTEKSAWVAGTSFTTSAGAVCADPNAPGNSSVSGTGVTISTTSAAANYDIYLSTSSTTPTTQDPTASTSSANSKAISDLSYGTTYYYWMRQNCGSSTSSWVAGSPTSFTTTIPAPTGLLMTPSLNGVTFTITDANDVNNYEIYYSTTNSEPGASPSGTATTTSKSKTVTGLPASTTYYCWVRATGPNANSSWYSAGSFATLTLSSISVSTPPTKTKYLVGDNFDPTALVITRTYSNSTSDTYTYSGHTSEFTFSPALNAALDDEDDAVTITYGGQTVDQSINVYTVTVNKVNISGTAIAEAGVSASCSGRTLSQSVGSTNYKFNTYAVTAGGVGISGSTITGTPTGNVTINAKFHDPITVTWKVGNGAASGSPTGEVKYGTAITALPSTPADNALSSCGTNKFMGWSASELTGTGNDAPADLFTTVGGAANLTTNTTYRAVFASSTSGAAANTVLFSENWTGVTNNTTPTSPSASGSTVYGSATITYKWTDGTTTTQTYTSGGPNSNENILISKSNGAWKASGIKTGNASKIVFTYAMSGSGVLAVSSPTSNVTVGGSSSGSYITFTDEVSTFDLEFKNTNSSNNLRLDDIEVKVYTAGTTAVDYQTGCCTAPGTALSITSANSKVTGGTVSLTSTGGNGGTVTWSVENGTGSATISDGVLTAGDVGTVTVKAHQNANTVLGVEYCAQDAEQAFTIVSSTVNVTGVEVSPTSKAIVPGETFTITATVAPADATDKSVSWSSSASDKASVSSGTVTGVAAGSATITCTTTDGSYTDETAVTVYAVTMQALDEDGNAIAVGGPGTPSRTGASISPAADAGNYVFKEWAISGASLGSSASTKSNTITNPTGAVTVTAKYYKPRVVKWSVGGDDSYEEGSPTLTVAYNSAISAVPDAPDDDALNNCANKFMGWSTKSWGSTTGKDDSDYDDLFTTAGGYTTGITDATKTFYAVFAESAESGTYSDGTTHVWTGSTDGYSDWGGSMTKSWLRNNNAVLPTFEYTPDYNVKKVVLNVRQTNNTGSNTVAVSVGGTAIGSATAVTGDNVVYNMEFDHGTGIPLSGKVRIVATNTSANTTGQGTFELNSITLYEGSPNITYVNYVTQCASNQVRVTYDFNGGTGTACTQGVTTTNANYTVCSTVPAKDYYDFAGWEDGSGGDPIPAGKTNYNLQSTTTFTATWTPTVYSITYNLNGGIQQESPEAPTSYTYESSDVTLPTAPTKNHDRFDGWYGNADLSTGGVQTTIAAGSNGNKEYWAKWTARNEFKFYKDDELLTTIYRASDENLEAAASGTLSEQGAKPSDPSAPSACSSKVFVGWTETWFNDETDTEPADLSDATGKKAAGKTYYAVWATRAGSPGSYTYSAYSTTCCGKSVEVDGGSPSNGTVTFDKSYAWTCKGDREIVMTITPSAGYQLHTFSVATGDGKVAAKSMSADVALDNNSSAAQVITLTFAKDADGAYDVTATFTEMKITSWEWTFNSAEIPDPIDVYVGQKKQIDVVMSPSGVLNSHKNNDSYAHSVNSTYIANPNRAGAYFTFEGRAAVESTPITLTHNDDTSEPKAFALTFNVRVTALPRVHFVDNIHNETFDDVVATVSGDKTTVTMVQSTPTHADVAVPGEGNSCEKTHLHLIGWIRSDYSKVADYMNGTGEAPTKSELENAGTGYWFEPDADINVETYNGKTFYAVWAVEE